MKRAITVQDSLCSPEGSKEQLLAPGTAIHSTYVHLSNGISLSVTTFIPVTVSKYPPVVMVPGLFSVMDNFRHLLPDLTRDFTCIIWKPGRRTPVFALSILFSALKTWRMI